MPKTKTQVGPTDPTAANMAWHEAVGALLVANKPTKDSAGATKVGGR